MTIFEAAHRSGALPLLLAAVLSGLGWRVGAEHWWVASAFGVSVFADAAMKAMGGTFDVTFYYTPVQTALVLWAFQSGIILRGLTLMALVALGWLSAHVASGFGAEWILTVSGGALICYLAWRSDTLTWALLAYFGAGTLAYLWMLPTIGTEAIYPRWLTYQSCRWAAFILFALDLYRNRRRAWT